MHCEVVRDGEGKPYSLLCGGKKVDRNVCPFCRRHFIGYLCDFPTRPDRPCGVGICEQCQTTTEDGLNFCPRHAIVERPAKQASLF